jgi:cytosine/adenosine deaminase-related metal-dependent hydrolase
MEPVVSGSIMKHALPPSTGRIAIRGSWVLACANGQLELLKDHTVFVNGNCIEAITQDQPAACDEVVEYESSLLLPGFINLHSHILNGAMFRGIPDDARFEAPWMQRLIYQLLMPLGQLTLATLDKAEIRSLVQLGMLDVMRGGSTTLVDQWHLGQEEAFFSVAEEMGIRAYGAPSIMSASNFDIAKDGEPQFEFNRNEMGMLDRALGVYKTYNQGPQGRLGVIFGPHAPDTCSPELLRAVGDTARTNSALITTHLSQTPEEVKAVEGRYGKNPVEYLDSVGLLGPNLIAAHCVEATDDDLGTLKRTDTAIANCVISFARAGTSVPLSRYSKAGIRTGIGTDSHGMNLISELRTAGFFSKLHDKCAYAATAYDLVNAATTMGASALRREDLGRLAPGAKADIIVVSLSRPHLQPVWDPIKNLIWKGSHADFAAIMIDGRFVMRDGECPHVDEREIIKKASAAAMKVWALAEKRGVLNRTIA